MAVDLWVLALGALVLLGGAKTARQPAREFDIEDPLAPLLPPPRVFDIEDPEAPVIGGGAFPGTVITEPPDLAREPAAVTSEVVPRTPPAPAVDPLAAQRAFWELDLLTRFGCVAELAGDTIELLQAAYLAAYRLCTSTAPATKQVTPAPIPEGSNETITEVPVFDVEDPTEPPLPAPVFDVEDPEEPAPAPEFDVEDPEEPALPTPAPPPEILDEETFLTEPLPAPEPTTQPAPLQPAPAFAEDEGDDDFASGTGGTGGTGSTGGDTFAAEDEQPASTGTGDFAAGFDTGADDPFI